MTTGQIGAGQRGAQAWPLAGSGRLELVADDQPFRVDEPSDLGEQVRARIHGFAEVAAVQRAELRGMTQEQAARIADELLQLLPAMPPEPDRGSGLVEQQRLFARARP